MFEAEVQGRNMLINPQVTALLVCICSARLFGLICTRSASCLRLPERFLRRNVLQWVTKLFLKRLKGAFVHRSPEKQGEFQKLMVKEIQTCAETSQTAGREL